MVEESVKAQSQTPLAKTEDIHARRLRYLKTRIDAILEKKRFSTKEDNKVLNDLMKKWSKFYHDAEHDDPEAIWQHLWQHVAKLYMNSFRVEMESNAKELTMYETFLDFIYHIVRGLTERDREIDKELKGGSEQVEEVVTSQLAKLIQTIDRKRKTEEERKRRKWINNLGTGKNVKIR